MVLQDLDYAFDTLDVECKGYIEWIELQEFDETIYNEPLNIDQLEAAITTVCGPDGKCRKEYFSDIVKELERRHSMEEKVKWDFRALDLKDVGRISIQSALFLFKAVHGDRFSQAYWKKFIRSRANPDDDVDFDEVKIHLCNIPEYASGNSDEDFLQQNEAINKIVANQNYDNHSQLQKLQEDDAYFAAAERDRILKATKIKNHADHLLNRIDEIGMQALLEDDLGDNEFEGRAVDKVTATELLNALKAKYEVLREKLLAEMLRIHIGEGMWQTLSEHEQHEKIFQLKLKEEKLRKEGKLDVMAIHLPGSRVALKYNVFGLMGESRSELDKRIHAVEEKIKESGLPAEEIEAEFLKKLDNKDNEKSSTESALIDVNNRYIHEKDALTNKLQGLAGYSTLSAIERENYLFLIIQARLRGVQESLFASCGICVGLSERVQPLKYDRSLQDPSKQLELSSYRLKSHKNKRAHDGPTVPPKLFTLKSTLGRVDLALQLVQESERRYALEREVFLSMMNSKDCLMHRMPSRKLTEDERCRQLSVLLAQWQGWRIKPASEKIQARAQNRRCLEESLSLKFESVKEELREKNNAPVDDTVASVHLLAALQMKQDEVCRKLLNVGFMKRKELEELWKEQIDAIVQEWFDNIAVVLFGIIETTDEEEELLKALSDKYDTLRDKLLMDALMKQYSQAEWDKMSEQERQNKLAKLRQLERKLRREGKYDELAKLLGDAASNSDLLNKMLGENRQKYLDQLNERLQNRQRRIADGEDPDTIEDLMEETPDTSSGNVLKDLDKRFDDERDALLRRLRDENDREARERERQAEIARLKLEARKAGRESNFDSAALVLGLSERNRASLEDSLKNDRERQEQLARARLAARRQRKNTKTEDETDQIEPSSDDISGWKDFVLKELSHKHEKERNLFLDMLQETESEDLKQEAREMSADDKNERLNKLRSKRDELDLAIKSDQEEHTSILEMSMAVKYVTCEALLKDTGKDASQDDIIISLTADLQQLQDEETRIVLDSLAEKSQPELVALRNKQLEDRQQGKVENVAKLIFSYEGSANDDAMVKALDKKYDALLDKLALEALKKQISDAEWAKLSEQERQAKLMKLRLEQKRLLKEGKLDEAARLLGEGFKAEDNLKKLMGENKKKYDELLQERLRERRERIARGEPVDDLDAEGLPEENESNQETDAKSILEDLQKRYDEEKDALLSRLHGADTDFMTERDRQAELARLKREQRRAEQEEKFGAAALVLGLAERNKTALNERLQNDRTRQEQLAKERLDRLREKRSSQQNEEDLKVVSDGDDIINAAMKLLERRHALEQESLVEYLQNLDSTLKEQAALMTANDRNNSLQQLKELSKDTSQYSIIMKEMATLKLPNRLAALQAIDKDVSNDNVIVSILADLQQKQDNESEAIIKHLPDKTKDELIKYQEDEIRSCTDKTFSNLPLILSQHEETKVADEDALVDALDAKYDALKDKLILDALEKQMGDADWANMNEKDRQWELMKIKLEQRKLKEEGKNDEATRIMKELLKQDTNLQSLLGSSKAEQEKRLKEKLEQRRKRREEGMSEKEIEKVEAEEDKAFEEEVAKTSTGNVLEDIEKNYESEKEALLNMLNNADSALNTERQRQIALARLRRDAKKAQAEEKFDAVALVFGMAKAQEAALSSKMENNRMRQEQLARQRLEARKKRRAQAHEEAELVKDEEIDETVAESNDLLVLQENVLSEMEKKHSEERDLIMKLIQDAATSDFKTKAQSFTPEERKTKLFELKEFRTQWRDANDSPEEQKEIFDEAVVLKIEELRADDNIKTEEDIEVKLLADLQDSQDKEAEYMMKDLHDKNALTLKQLIKIQQLARQLQWNDNIASALLGIKVMPSLKEDADAESDIMEALKEKYDALKEKVYLEALKAKHGDDWDKMSEKEKQEHLTRMKANEELHNNDEQMQNDLDSVTLPGMEKLVSKTRAKQERKLKDRMEKRKRAKAEGKSLDEIEKLEKDEDAEEENDAKKGSDVIKDLQDQFESEKDAILAMLNVSDTKELNERQRQLALAQLRREKRRIKQEEKYDGAALLMHLAKQNDVKKEQSYENERARQEQLARERIEAMKRRKKNSADKNESEKLLDEELADQNSELSEVAQIEREGTIALQDILLNEMEKKHTTEQDALLDMLQRIDKSALDKARELSDDDRNEKLGLIAIRRTKIKEQSRGFLNSQPPENTMNEAEKKSFNDSLAKGRSTLQNVLNDGLTLLVANKINELPTDLSGDQLTEEASVLLMADLQEKQTQENNALMQALVQTDRETTARLKQEQRKSRRAGWMDNIASVVFDDVARKKKEKEADTESLEKELREEEDILQHEVEDQMKQIEKEIEEEKQQKLSTMSADDIDQFIEEMKRQEERKKAEVQDQIKRHREIAKQRLEEKRRKRDDKMYESDLANAMITNAHKRTAMMREKTMALQGAQKDTLEERLRKRREDRKRRLEEEEEVENQRIEKERIEAENQKQQQQQAEDQAKSQETSAAESTTNVPTSTVDETKPTEVKKKKVMPPLPGGGMRREKTVVEQASEISQNKKQEMINLLIREQTSLAVKIGREQSRQEEMVRILREKRRKKMEARTQEAAAVLGLGERQKTIVEDRKKGERDRQIGQVRERVQRMKHERTMTMKPSEEEDASTSFANLAQKQPDGLTDDERMQNIAKEMERKFKEGGVKSVTTELSVDEQDQIKRDKDEEARKEVQSRGKLDEKTRAQILKERQKAKKSRRASTMPHADGPVVEDGEVKSSDGMLGVAEEQ